MAAGAPPLGSLAFLPEMRPNLRRRSCRGRVVALEARPRWERNLLPYTQGRILRPWAWPLYPLENFWDFTALPLRTLGWSYQPKQQIRPSNGSLHQAAPQACALAPGTPTELLTHPIFSADRCVWFPTRCATTRKETGPPQEVRRAFGRCLETPTTQKVDIGGMAPCRKACQSRRVLTASGFSKQGEGVGPCPSVSQQGHKKPKDLCVTN